LFHQFYGATVAKEAVRGCQVCGNSRPNKN